MDKNIDYLNRITMLLMWVFIGGSGLSFFIASLAQYAALPIPSSIPTGRTDSDRKSSQKVANGFWITFGVFVLLLLITLAVLFYNPTTEK